MTLKDVFGQDESTVLLRLNLLLEKGYNMNTPRDVLDTVWLKHKFKRELDLILYPCGLINQLTPTPTTKDDGPEYIRINEEDHQEFLKFVNGLPKINIFHRAFSIFYRD